MIYFIDPDDSRRVLVCAILSRFGLETTEFSAPAEFLANFDETRPASVLFTMHASDPEDMEALTRLLSEPAMYPVVVLALGGDIGARRGVLKAGAVEFLPYPCRWQEAANCLLRCFEEDLMTRASRCAERTRRERFWILTGRERQVLELPAAGMSNKEIAWELGTSRRTIEVHRAHIMKKLRMRSFVELIFSYAIATIGAAPKLFFTGTKRTPI